MVASDEPLNFTVESPPKLLPFTVNVKAALPTGVLVGLIELIDGAAPTVKFAAFDPRPPEVTLTENVPAVVIRLAGTDAVNCVGFATVVLSVFPLKLTVAPDEKPVPLTVSVNVGPPAVALSGERELTVGVTVNVAAFEVAPPEVSVIESVPASVRRLAVTSAVT